MNTPPENNLSDILSRRPVQAYQRLLSVLEDKGHVFSLAPGESAEKSMVAESKIWLITRGVFAVVRESDASWLGTASAPFVLGLSGLFSAHAGSYSLMAQNSCQGISVERDVFIQCLEQHHLWQDVAHIQAWLLELLLFRDSWISSGDAYQMIRRQLLNLMKLPYDIRITTPVESYIRHHTSLSRSSVFRILSQLRKGKFVLIKKGKLINVARLPEKY
ncbi:helix-turn-helix domain-containing protein [Pseudescherichia vulneris]|uniref:helix-turn-helix domain-containing protein n=1 Tax=Pseudescherichia vulneris TaxID=566 RepID=UPI001EDD4C4F|nr:helix-turn-helix domain-containing protein [Pseudescherichia vulneris]